MQILKNVGRDDHNIRIPKFKIVSISGVKVKQSAVLYLIKISFFCYLQTQNFTLYGELKKCFLDLYKYHRYSWADEILLDSLLESSNSRRDFDENY